MKILHLEAYNYSDGTIDKIKGVGELCVKNPNSELELQEILKDNSFDVIIIALGFYWDEKLLANQQNLQFIISPTTGLNHIDLEYCSKRNIEVISLKGEQDFLSTITSTAEHTWTLLLSLIRNISSSTQHVKDGGWQRTLFLADELYSKTLGIIGYGRLGKIVAGYGKAFGMNVLINDVSSNLDSNIKQTNIDTLLAESDFILLMASWNKENEKMINENTFHKMKRSSYFINTSRGEMVDEDALLDALNNNKIKGAGLDVLVDDSVWNNHSPAMHKLIEYAKNNSNLIITPHSGGYGKDSIHRTREFIIDKFLKRITNGR